MKTSSQVSPKPEAPIPFQHNKEPQTKSQAVSTLVKRTINEEASLKVYPHCVIYKPAPKSNPHLHRRHPKRSSIKCFSKRSRFRLFETMAKIKSNLPNQPFFVSLTYHYGHENKEIADKTCLHNFLVSLRDYDHDVQYIWRIELQKRGTPHYHLIIFPQIYAKMSNRNNYLKTISRIWHRVGDPKSKIHKEYGCDVRNISNYRQACTYINKYLAKVPEGETGLDKGKHWGCSRDLPNKPFETVPLSRQGRGIVIMKLRKWLLKNGKEKYLNDEYFNEDRPQTVFIDARDFYTLMGDNLQNMDFSKL